jgi:uncharacterized membrane protein YwzB
MKVIPIFWLSEYLMKVIPIFWLSASPDEVYSNLLTFSVPDEVYSNLLTMSVPDEGYSNLLTMSVTWWSLFQSFDYERHLMKFIFQSFYYKRHQMKFIPIFWLWAYLMKFIPIFWLWASPDEVYSNLLTMSVTWWSLFQSFDYERHLMKVIPEKSCARVISRFYFSRHVHRIIIEISLVSKAKFLKLIRHRKF